MGKMIGVQSTYTDDMVTFTNAGGSSIDSIVVTITPSQSYNGYAAPWGPGYGKNKLPTTQRTSGVINEVTVTVNSDGSITLDGTASGDVIIGFPTNPATIDLPNASYTLSGGLSSSIYLTLYDGTDNTGTRYNNMSSAKTFTLTSGHIYAPRLVMTNGTTASNVTIYPMLRLSSESATYEPYANVCPVVGATSAKVHKAGKNLANYKNAERQNSSAAVTILDDENGFRLRSTSSAANVAARIKNLDLKGGVTYTFSVDAVVTAGSPRICFRRTENNAIISATSTPITADGHYYVTYAMPSDDYAYLAFFATGSTAETGDVTFSKVKLEVGSSDTAFEPFIGNNYTTNWYNQVGMICNGTVDIVSGKVISSPVYDPYNGEELIGPWLSSWDEYVPGGTPTIGAQVVDLGGVENEYQVSSKRIGAVSGVNYFWANISGNIVLKETSPARGFLGWLIKCVTNGIGVEIPLKYMRAETYTVTPDQRMEWSAERDVTGVLHRETVQNLPPKIEFSTPLMDNSGINALNTIIRNAYTDELQRNITIQFYDPERNEYWEWDCYMPDVKYQIRNVDSTNKIVNYEEIRYAFIGY